MQWLLENSAFHDLKTAFSMLKSGVSREEIGAFFLFAKEPNKVDLLSIAGNVATISISGVLRNESQPFWGTGYPDIIDAISRAESNPTVTRVDFVIDSPGGMVSGLFDVTDAISAMEKPTRAVVSNLAASAAYAIAAQAGEIVATSKAATFGSIGIIQSFIIFEDEVSITSSNAPNKNPDPTTDAGATEIRRHLDDLHGLFVDAISAGRGVSAEVVNESFGRGGVFIASEALKRGMVDSVQLVAQNVSKGNNSQSNEVTSMDLQKLQSEHPEVYRAAVAAGLKIGAEKERDRVAAHLTYGEASGALEVAVKAIKDGSEITEALRAQYITAGMNRQSLKAMAEDNSAAKPDAKKEPEKSEEEKVAAIFSLVNDQLGIKG